MSEEEKINPGHDGLRRKLRVVGPAVFVVGLVFSLIGFVSFFMAFSSMGPPRYFWCIFLGFPLMIVGSAISKFAYIGAVSRYVAGETAPVAKDTFNYMASGTKDGVRDITSAIAQGLAGDSIKCNSCGDSNDMNAKFCDNCGQPFRAPKICDQCSTENQPDAKFCDDCGNKFATTS